VRDAITTAWIEDKQEIVAFCIQQVDNAITPDSPVDDELVL